jgi:hypothetical protein
MEVTFSLAFWLSLAVALLTLAGLGRVAWGASRLQRLHGVPPLDGGEWPSVAIVVSALDEAATIEPALRSLLAMDYPRLEVIALNDRSTDGTSAILHRLARGDERLKVHDIAALPPGWLGKNHALWRGSQASSADYLLFTDADVVFAPDCVARAVACCEREGLDHLTLTPAMPVPEPLLAMLLCSFQLGLLLRFQPWKVRHSPRHFLGLGVFNLVRRAAYARSGGHAAIPLEVLDDLMLGRLLKRAGAVQDVRIGGDLLSVAWYGSTAEMFLGLRKNLFAALRYRVDALLAASLAALLLGLWPWVGLVFTSGAARWLCVATAGLQLAVTLAQLREAKWRFRSAFYQPVITLVALAMLWQACALTWLRGGVAWRGTFYPLAELKRAAAGLDAAAR